jgi:FkbM family methyltransferase
MSSNQKPVLPDNVVKPPDYVDPEAVEEVTANLKRVKFPGGFTCYTHTTPEETGLIYNEVMVQQEYFRYGLSVMGAHCVFDVGANIGMFTLAVKMKAPQAAVYAFEAIKDTCQVLEKNVQLHNYSDVHAYNVAIGSLDGGERLFTYYPNMAGNSTADPGLKNGVRPVMDQLFGKEWADYMYESETRVVKVRSLASVILEQRISSIDYLKIDVEGDEMEVLGGIEEEQWPMIRQAAVEAHNDQLRKQVSEYLASRNFEIFGDIGISSPLGVSTVYGRKG